VPNFEARGISAVPLEIGASAIARRRAPRSVVTQNRRCVGLRGEQQPPVIRGQRVQQRWASVAPCRPGGSASRPYLRQIGCIEHDHDAAALGREPQRGFATQGSEIAGTGLAPAKPQAGRSSAGAAAPQAARCPEAKWETRRVLRPDGAGKATAPARPGRPNRGQLPPD